MSATKSEWRTEVGQHSQFGVGAHDEEDEQRHVDAEKHEQSRPDRLCAAKRQSVINKRNKPVLLMLASNRVKAVHSA